MGQQQIILIVLSVIIVGTAIAVGLLLFQANAISANKDAIMQDLYSLIADARAYYLRPKSYGGGGRSYTGYQIPSKLVAKMQENATYSSSGIAGGVQFQAISKSYDGTITVKVDAFHTQPYGWNITGVDFEE